MIRVTLLFSFLFLVGCAAAFVSESRSPKTKIEQAKVLYYKVGRPLAAVRVLKQAIPLAQKKGRQRI